ncbi:SulP family inorganic anion transporter [Halovulum sp. GXIMD14794]
MTAASDPHPATDRAGVGAWLRAAVGALVVATLSVTFVISFATIVFSGPLSQFLSSGIGLGLLGSITMPIVATAFCSYRGVVCHPQDIPAVLMTLASAAIAGTMADRPPEQMFATVVALLATAALMTGLSLYLAGRFRLGFIARFIPYSVIGGFLAATGLVLTLGSLGMMIKEEVSVWSLHLLFVEGNPMRWLPWLAVATVMVVAARLIASDYVMPALLLISGAGFFAVLWLADLSVQDAADMRLLLGPFEGGNLLAGLSPALLAEADWMIVMTQAPTVLAIVAMVLLGTLLNASGIEVATGHDLDLNRDLKAIGAANAAAGLTGGFVGYHLLGETLLAHRMGFGNVLAGISVAAGTALVLFMGASLIGVLPAGLMAAVIGYLGLDMLYRWLWVQRRRLPVSDMMIILLIVVVAGLFGFLQALSVGVLLAAAQFVISYAGLDVMRAQSTAAVRRSSIERGAEDMAILARAGAGTRIVELTGFIFFGTANRLLDRLRHELGKAQGMDRLILDFAHVTGVDTSAIFALSRLSELCERAGVALVLTGLSEAQARQVARSAELSGDVRRVEKLDDALIDLEEELLAAEPRPGHDFDPLADLAARYPQVDFAAFTEHLSLKPGDVLLQEGDRSATIYQLRSGQLRAETGTAEGRPLVVARFHPGAVVGEIAHYAGVPRTATVIADEASEVVRIDLDALDRLPGGQPVALELHRAAAGYLARRLMRMTQVFRDAGL